MVVMVAVAMRWGEGRTIRERERAAAAEQQCSGRKGKGDGTSRRVKGIKGKLILCKGASLRHARPRWLTCRPPAQPEPGFAMGFIAALTLSPTIYFMFEECYR